MRVYIDLYLFLHAMNIFCIVIMMFIIVAYRELKKYLYYCMLYLNLMYK